MIYCNICGTTHECTVCPKCGGVAMPKRDAPPEIHPIGWLGVGPGGVIRIVNDMMREARQWQDFASANQLAQKLDYYKGKADALSELLKVLKVLAPTPNGVVMPTSDC